MRRYKQRQNVGRRRPVLRRIHKPGVHDHRHALLSVRDKSVQGFPIHPVINLRQKTPLCVCLDIIPDIFRIRIIQTSKFHKNLHEVDPSCNTPKRHIQVLADCAVLHNSVLYFSHIRSRQTKSPSGIYPRSPSRYWPRLLIPNDTILPTGCKQLVIPRPLRADNIQYRSSTPQNPRHNGPAFQIRYGRLRGRHLSKPERRAGKTAIRCPARPAAPAAGETNAGTPL